ncbi:MAG: response regulator [Lentimicrobium sp.]|jgi:CheY-like chemotaxis protein|nr:response regulator [Lentimicrobium sp.]
MSSKVDINKLAHEIPLRILVAEDNLVNQKFLVSLLNIMGYKPASVLNGREVLEMMETESFDIIFMDIQMPEMSGIEATQLIMMKYAPADRPYIIAITANAMNNERDRCLQVGMVDFMVKPVNIKILQSILENWGRKVQRKSSAGV